MEENQDQSPESMEQNKKKGIFLTILEEEGITLEMNGEFSELVALVVGALLEERSDFKRVISIAIKFLEEEREFKLHE